MPTATSVLIVALPRSLRPMVFAVRATSSAKVAASGPITRIASPARMSKAVAHVSSSVRPRRLPMAIPCASSAINNAMAAAMAILRRIAYAARACHTTKSASKSVLTRLFSRKAKPAWPAPLNAMAAQHLDLSTALAASMPWSMVAVWPNVRLAPFSPRRVCHLFLLLVHRSALLTSSAFFSRSACCFAGGCMPCSSECLTGCTDFGADNCIGACRSVRLWSGECASHCPVGTYNDESNVCQKCHRSCVDSCVGPFPNQCNAIKPTTTSAPEHVDPKSGINKDDDPGQKIAIWSFFTFGALMLIAFIGTRQSVRSLFGTNSYSAVNYSNLQMDPDTEEFDWSAEVHRIPILDEFDEDDDEDEDII
eukprot:m.236827 g.236827  ORF g.236827 m.236827 type:complete len:365 (-) comp10902_c0_seq2:238-1332(-)